MTVPITYDLLGLLAAIVVLLVVRKLRRRQDVADAGKSVAASTESAATAAEQDGQVVPAGVVASRDSGESAIPARAASVEVSEIDLLDEIEIYLTYGMLDQAAITLAWYVDHTPGDTRQRARLRELYIKLGKNDLLAELLESDLATGAIGPEDAKEILLASLEHQPSNLALRVFADQYLGLPPEALPPIPEIVAPENVAKLPPEHETAVFATSSQTPSYHEPEPSSSDVSSYSPSVMLGEYNETEEKYPLLSGMAPLGALSEEEQRVVSTLVSPTRLVELLRQAGQVDEELQFLRKQINKSPAELRWHSLLLERLFSEKEKTEYGLALLRLFLVLQGRGIELQNRLLEKGKLLGDSPLWDALEAADGDLDALYSLALQYGVPVDDIAASHAHSFLVEECKENDSVVYEVYESNAVVREYDMLMEYGQVAEALDLLENSIANSKEPKIYLNMLLDLYKRLPDSKRIIQFQRRLLTEPTAGDDNSVLAINDMLDRARIHDIDVKSAR